MTNLSPELLKEIEKLVKRANHGDQNAMAMIEQVRKNAQGGIALAQQSHAAIMQCVMGADPTAPTIAPDAKQALAAMKNPAITPDRLLQILCFMPHIADGALLHVACIVLSKLPEPKVAVAQTMVPPATVQPAAPGLNGEFGVMPGEWNGHCPPMGNGIPPNCIPWRGNQYAYARHALDHARRIQAVRNTGLPPSMINADMGWELDC